ncbi:hypothetical protein FRAAL1174 [Frankia alni ACN14a]|uniref:Uncharacterized protein n=1 Tax=Frankia alni (strain DSM 45986 / CECT 9034 / ACN14a) TaxID=326424 RepID=Q0RAM7_FRAAA|nr:hypothetical protein FRAAL1174 [Frankia alni ACN14a]
MLRWSWKLPTRAQAATADVRALLEQAARAVATAASGRHDINRPHLLVHCPIRSADRGRHGSRGRHRRADAPVRPRRDR